MSKEEQIAQLQSIIPKFTKEQSWYCLDNYHWNLNNAILFALENEIYVPKNEDPNCPYKGNDKKPKVQIDEDKNEKENQDVEIEDEFDIENQKEKRKKEISNNEENTELNQSESDLEKYLDEDETTNEKNNHFPNKDENETFNEKENETETEKEKESVIGNESPFFDNDFGGQEQDSNYDGIQNMFDENAFHNEEQMGGGEPQNKDVLVTFLKHKEFGDAYKYLQNIKNDRESKIKSKWLLSAIKYGAVEVIKLLVECGVDINYTNPRKSHPVDLAIKHNQTESLVTVLQLGGDPNGDTNTFDVPIERALENNQPLMVKLLLQYGSKTTNSMGENVLIQSAKRGKIQDIKTLLKSGFAAQTKGKRGVNSFLVTRSIYMKNMIKKITKINFLNIYQNIDQKQREELSNWILSLKDKDYSELNNENITKIFELALSNEFKKEIKTLIDSKFKIDQLRDSYNNYLVHLCVYYSNYWLAKLLMSIGARVDVSGGEYKTPLQVASEYNNILIFIIYYLHSKQITISELERYKNSNVIIDLIYRKLKELKTKHSKNISFIFKEFKQYTEENHLISKHIDLNSDFQFHKKIDENKQYIKHLIKYKNNYYINTRYIDFHFKSDFIEKYFPMVANSNKPQIKKVIEPLLGFYFTSEKDVTLHVNTITECNSLPTLRPIIQTFSKKNLSFDPILILSIAKQIVNILSILKNKFNYYVRGLNTLSIQITNNAEIKLKNIFAKSKFSYYNFSGYSLSNDNNEKSNLYSFGIIIWELFMCKTYDNFIHKRGNTQIYDHNHKIPEKMLNSLRKKKLQNSYTTSNSANRILIFNSLRDIVYECLSLGKYQLNITIEEIYNKIEKCYHLIPDKKIVSRVEKDFLNKINELKIRGDISKKLFQDGVDYNNNKKNSNFNPKLNLKPKDSIDWAINETIGKINLECSNTIKHLELFIWEMFVVLKNIVDQDNSLTKKYKFIVNLFKSNGWLENKFTLENISKEFITNLLKNGIINFNK
ncbi:ankyrin repeat-containing protein [Anaeramoeba flamelloides]|uniref:Ankyrin repeat-containing protein n=1 Tax=Anaeramoeba flamelloides TaxID=1746091 RepID=A0AAV8AE51_9EUKA|nr:ankyrin repeat-containing protein [Anaeramoeba flamelloides]